MIPVSSIKRKASVIFYLVDDFTGKAVTAATITVSGQQIPYVNKLDGYYVFTNLGESESEFVIVATPYLIVKKKVRITDAVPIVIPISLQHAANSRIIEGYTRITGVVERHTAERRANETIQIVVISPATSVRLVEDASQGTERVRLYCKQGHQLVEKQFYIASEDHQELVKIVKYNSTGGCFSLERNLQHKYHTGTPLYRLWNLQTSTEGIFVLPLAMRFDKEQSTVDVLVMHQENIYKKEVVLNDGKAVELQITI